MSMGRNRGRSRGGIGEMSMGRNRGSRVMREKWGEIRGMERNRRGR